MYQISRTWFRFNELNISNNVQLKKRFKSYKFEQFIDSKKSFLIKLLFTKLLNINDQMFVETKMRSSNQISMIEKFFNKKRFKFWNFINRSNDSYEQQSQSRNDLLRLICLNKNNKRILKTWLRFDIDANDHSILIFTNSKISHYFIIQRIIN